MQNTNENKYGTRLRQLREERQLTQEQLAKLLNTSRSRIGMYEQGKRQPDFEMQETIADFFNVSIDYLFGREEDERIKDTLFSSMEYQLFLFDPNLSLEEKEDAEKVMVEVMKLSPENRAHLLEVIKSLLPVLSAQKGEEDTTE